MPDYKFINFIFYQSGETKLCSDNKWPQILRGLNNKGLFLVHKVCSLQIVGGYGQCEHSESEVNGRVAIEHSAGCWAIEKRDLRRVSHSSLIAQLRDDTWHFQSWLIDQSQSHAPSTARWAEHTFQICAQKRGAKTIGLAKISLEFFHLTKKRVSFSANPIF